MIINCNTFVMKYTKTMAEMLERSNMVQLANRMENMYIR